MRQMTLEQIDLEGNGFHEALNAFIIFHTMASLGKLKLVDAAVLSFKVLYMKGDVKIECCSKTLLQFVVNHVLIASTVLLKTVHNHSILFL